jgi:hypothetical protein
VAPPSAAVEKYVRANRLDEQAFHASDFHATNVGDQIHDDVYEDAARLAAEIDGAMTRGTADHSQLVTLRSIPLTVTLLVVDHDVEPKLIGSGSNATYKPGEVAGRAYVFSARDSKIVCAATIDVHNDPSSTLGSYLDDVRAAGSDGAAVLHREIEVRIREAIANSLRATP